MKKTLSVALMLCLVLTLLCGTASAMETHLHRVHHHSRRRRR